MYVNVSDEDLIEYVGDLNTENIVKIISGIDAAAASWDLTFDLANYFIKEMKSYYQNSEDFNNFLESFKEEE